MPKKIPKTPIKNSYPSKSNALQRCAKKGCIEIKTCVSAHKNSEANPDPIHCSCLCAKKICQGTTLFATAAPKCAQTKCHHPRLIVVLCRARTRTLTPPLSKVASGCVLQGHQALQHQWSRYQPCPPVAPQSRVKLGRVPQRCLR